MTLTTGLPAPPGALARDGELSSLLEVLAGSGATGALRGEYGTVHLADGAVTHAESHLAPGPAVLLTVSGRLSPQLWQLLLLGHGPSCRVGSRLVAQGHLSQGELELCALSTLYDAGYFALASPAATAVFDPGARHWLGPVVRVGARALLRETARRQQLLTRIWPWPQVDTAPLVPARTSPGAVGRRSRPRLSPRGRELLALADGRRTPADLALLLGRSAFATLAEVRRLAAAGYAETPFTGHGSPQAGRLTPVPPPLPTPDRFVPPPRQAPEPRRAPEPRPASATAAPLPRPEATLSRREATRPRPEAVFPRPEATLPRPETAAAPLPRRSRPAAPVAAPPPSAHDPDIALLTRVLTALEARL
ncbi:hypothetical protein ABT095_07795 [Kitasatospora sp. NPDC002227]|uniref:hypothetical protein n=1 Tax=Kitasatospora sp. NPDC002227 TaxID=3154773 RepID=UPI003320F9D2